MTVTKQQFVAEARKLLGTPYSHEGRTLGERADCLCVPWFSAHNLGLSTYSISGYSRVPDGVSILKICRSLPELVEVTRYDIADMIVMAWHRVPCHLGVVGDYPHPGEFSVIHADSIHKKVVEHRIDTRWHQRIIASFRFRELV